MDGDLSIKVEKKSKKLGFRFVDAEDGKGMKCVAVDANPQIDIPHLTGCSNDDVINDIIASATRGRACGEHTLKLNLAIQTLAEYEPRDLNEARLSLQASTLYAEGMRYLGKANNAEMLCHSEFYMKSALKLLRLHNETLEALSRYRRGGEQKVIVQHVNVNNGGQAIVGTLSAREGGVV